jgi:hypothetical protein
MFHYHSEQIHSTKGQTRRNIVNIKNGKGYKAVETYDKRGKLVNKTRKNLKKSEMSCIKKNKFIPGLFKDCIKK